jgi:two-component system, OmpR family, sensor kinase
LSSEQKTIKWVLVVYLTSTFLLVITLAFVYFRFESENFKENLKKQFITQGEIIHKELEKLQRNSSDELIYPRFNEFESAIFDSDKKLIFSTNKRLEVVDFDQELYNKDDFVYFTYEAKPYYLGAKYIVIEGKNIDRFSNYGLNILLLTIFILCVVGITSLFLVRLILKPMRENINLLDRFIKDTTHELNTPISTILTNIEMIEEQKIDGAIGKKIDRIKIASKTISTLYDDLVYLTLNKNTITKNELVFVSDVLKDRIEYFSLMFKSKNIKVELLIDGDFELLIDKSKLARLIDNLLSNSYKYGNKNSTLKIFVTPLLFQICDEGIGMDENEILRVFERYSRFDNTVGGFGIGYSIIKKIVDEYGMLIKIDSQKGVGTCITIKK